MANSGNITPEEYDKIKEILSEINRGNESYLNLVKNITRELSEQEGTYYDMYISNENMRQVIKDLLAKHEEYENLQKTLLEHVKKISEQYGIDEKELLDKEKLAEKINEEEKERNKYITENRKLNDEIFENEKKSNELSKEKVKLIKECRKLKEELNDASKTDAEKDDIRRQKKENERRIASIVNEHRNIQSENEGKQKKKSKNEEKIVPHSKKIADLKGIQNDAQKMNASLEQAEVLSGRFRDNIDEARASVRALNENTSILTSLWQGVVNEVKKASDYWLEVEDRTFKLSRALGAGEEQARAFFLSQIKQTQLLAREYGMTQEELMNFQKSYADTTGKAILLTKAETEEMAAMSKLSSPEIANDLVNGLSKMGMSIKDVSTVFGVVETRARALGLNAAKATEAVSKNIDKLNQYTFKSGVDGLTRMVLRSQELRVSMDAMMGAVDKFGNIEDAMQNSAKLQMLGGGFAAGASNPMGMMYGSMADPNGLLKNIEGMLKGLAVMNRSTGEMTISPVDMMRIKAASEALGISAQELTQMSKSLAKEQEVASYMGGSMDQFTDAQKALIKSKAQWDAETQSFKIDVLDVEGKVVGQKDVKSITAKDIEALGENTIDEENAFKDIRAIANVVTGRRFRETTRERAKATISKKEVKTGNTETLRAIEAQNIDPIMDKLKDLDKYLGGKIGALSQWGPIARTIIFVGAGLASGLGGAIGNIFNKGISNVTRRLAGRLTTRFGGRSFSSAIGSSFRNFGSKTVNFFKGGKVGNALSKAGNILKGAGKILGNAGKATLNAAGKMGSAAAKYGGKAVSSTAKYGGKVLNWGKNLFNFGGGSIAKGLSGGAAILGVVEGAYGVYKASKEKNAKNKIVEESTTINETSKERIKNEYKDKQIVDTAKSIGGAIGTVAGTAIPIPILGPIIGNVVGKGIGWAAGKAINAVRNIAGEKQTAEQKAKSDIQVAFERQKIDATTIEDPQVMEKGALATIAIHSLLVTHFNKKDGLREDGSKKGWLSKVPLIGGFFAHGGIVKAAEGSVIPGNSYSGDKVPVMANSGEMILNQNQQKNLFNILKVGLGPLSYLPNIIKGLTGEQPDANNAKADNTIGGIVASSISKAFGVGKNVEQGARSSMLGVMKMMTPALSLPVSSIMPGGLIGGNLLESIGGKSFDSVKNVAKSVVKNTAIGRLISGFKNLFVNNNIENSVKEQEITPVDFMKLKGINNNFTEGNNAISSIKDTSIKNEYESTQTIKNSNIFSRIFDLGKNAVKTAIKNTPIYQNYKALTKLFGYDNTTNINGGDINTDNVAKSGDITNIDNIKRGDIAIEKTPVDVMKERVERIVNGNSINASAIQQPSIKPIDKIGEKTVIAPSVERMQYGTNTSFDNRDINLNISGSIRLEGQGLGANFNLNELLKDEGFKRQLTEIVKSRLNNEGNVSKVNKESSIINTQKMYNGV